jgi:hypothetical protein
MPDHPVRETALLDWICENLMRSRDDAEAVLLLVVIREGRAEIAAAEEAGSGLVPAVLLRRLADELESGSGIPIGRNGQTITR